MSEDVIRQIKARKKAKAAAAAQKKNKPQKRGSNVGKSKDDLLRELGLK